MRKNNGFVFMETVVVVCVLSITLLILYASYAHILRTSREKKTFDTTDSIYTTYYVKKIITQTGNVATFFSSSVPGANVCKSACNGNAYICDMAKLANIPGNRYYQLYKVYDVDKLYYLSPNTILTNTKAVDWLMEFDATTIDYIQNLGKGTGLNNKKILIVKYKHNYPNGTYEVIHASVEV